MSGTKEVTIDIGKVPGKDGVDQSSDESNKYYYTDEEDGGIIDITLSEHIDNIPGYVTLTYKPRNPEAKISDIKDGEDSDIGFEIFPDYCKSVTVYYWSGDSTYGNPLVLQLDGDNKYYTDPSGVNDWKEDREINSDGLLTTLDKFSCSENIHLVDISQNTNSYACSTCNKPNTIILHSDARNNYTRVTHSPNRFVCRLKNSQDNITSIPITKEIDKVYVYWYPFSGGESKPLLIFLPGPSTEDEEEEGTPSNYMWYQRESSDSSNWKPVKDVKPDDHTDCTKILKLLKQISPKSEGEDDTEIECKEPDLEVEKDESKGNGSGLGPGKIAAISVASVGGGSATAVTIWKWPNILSFLITRL